MLMDLQNLFSDKQAITSAGSHLSTNSLVRKPTNPSGYVAGATTYAYPEGASPTDDLGRGEPVPIVVQVVEDFAGGTDVTAQLVASDTVDSSGQLSGTVEVIMSTAAIPTATLKAGYHFRLGYIPPGVDKKYVALRYVSTGTYTAGKISAGIVMDKHLGQGVSI